MTEITRILSAIDQGDVLASSKLLPLVYDELRRLAKSRLADEMVGHTLQPTALVHEAYLRLVRDSEKSNWDSHGHFFAAAAEAMRRILVENARRKQRSKHGGGRKKTPLLDEHVAADKSVEDLLALDGALLLLASRHPEKARLVELRYFAGLTGDQAARILDISPSTADRYWTYARAWLRRQINSRHRHSTR
jgi:RNA polymerase sigma factor (TIGR02999 family)